MAKTTEMTPEQAASVSAELVKQYNGAVHLSGESEKTYEKARKIDKIRRNFGDSALSRLPVMGEVADDSLKARHDQLFITGGILAGEAIGDKFMVGKKAKELMDEHGDAIMQAAEDEYADKRRSA